MTRNDLLRETTLSEFHLAYHVEAATTAILAVEAGDIDLARIYGRIARRWLESYRASK